MLISPQTVFPIAFPSLSYNAASILFRYTVYTIVHLHKPLLVSFLLGGVGGKPGAPSVDRTDRMSGEDGLLCPL